MKPKIIFFDIDGTLVSFDTHSIPASAKTAINQLKNKDIKVVISTGRAFCDINNLEDLEFDGYIASNGTYCVDTKGEIIAQHQLSKESLKRLALYLDEKPFCCEFITNRGNFINFHHDVLNSLSELVNIPIPPIKAVSEIIEYDVFQLGVFVDVEREIELMNNVLTDCNSSRWHPVFTDITVKNCDKSTGVDCFLAYFGIEKDCSMAFGDGGNDISMLKHVAIGVAMGNANDDVKAAADYVADPIDKDGIFNALRHFKII